VARRDFRAAYSPSALIALPGDRMLQQMTLTLLEIGQKVVDPPLLSTGEVIQGGHNLGAGEIMYLDPDYEERMGEALRPLQWGVEWYDRRQKTLEEAFFLNVLNLPPTDGEKMTAYEVAQRMKECIRRASPLFEPLDLEIGYTGHFATTRRLTLVLHLSPVRGRYSDDRASRSTSGWSFSVYGRTVLPVEGSQSARATTSGREHSDGAQDCLPTGYDDSDDKEFVEELRITRACYSSIDLD
jgi:Bacteriophage head to tail connecting protein